MKIAGLTHLTAVSGSNCLIVIASVALILRSFRASRFWVGLGSAVALASFVILVGPDSSVLRAASMAYLGLTALLAGRGSRAGSLLAWCILGLLWANPWLSADLGFLLSVAATSGLLVLARPMTELLGHLAPRWLALLISIPLSAELFCSPLIVAIQGRLTPYSLLANVLATPLVPAITLLGMLAVVLASIFPPAANLFVQVTEALASYLAQLAHWVAALPHSTISSLSGASGFFLAIAINGTLVASLVALSRRQELLDRLMVWKLLSPTRAKVLNMFYFTFSAVAGVSLCAASFALTRAAFHFVGGT